VPFEVGYGFEVGDGSEAEPRDGSDAGGDAEQLVEELFAVERHPADAEVS
jgi:hypothetical protein